MEKRMSIHFIITGGTIDSYYEGTKDTVVPNKESIIPEFIGSLKLHHDCIFDIICMKDSRGIGEEELKKILHTVENSSYKKIIITHGTYSMPDTARFLEANLKRKDQTIILTGSMVPIKGFAPSDGPFNLGYSVAMLSNLKKGIFVCMNGAVLDPPEVYKIIKEGRFSSIFGEKMERT